MCTPPQLHNFQKHGTVFTKNHLESLCVRKRRLSIRFLRYDYFSGFGKEQNLQALVKLQGFLLGFFRANVVTSIKWNMNHDARVVAMHCQLPLFVVLVYLAWPFMLLGAIHK